MMKTLVTVGPNSLNLDDLTYFAEKTKLFRLNGSHSTIEWHKTAISMIRDVSPTSFILMDIPGIKPRTENLEPINIKKGEIIHFGEGGGGNKFKTIGLSKPLPKYPSDLKSFSVNDGQFIFETIKTGEGFVVGKSLSKFELLPKKGINLPGSVYNEKLQFEIYCEFLKKIEELSIDGIGLSFVQTGELAGKMRSLAKDLVIISKIENSEGLKNAKGIAKKSDAVMIDRGDLAAEIGLHGLYSAVETIALQTKLLGKPLIMATENLETMINRETPSKSEVMSIAHSASIGADCIMLSEETALSPNAKLILGWLEGFGKEIGHIKPKLSCSPNEGRYKLIWNALSNFPSIPVLMVTKSGYAIFDYFATHPQSELFLVSETKKTIKLTMLYRNSIQVIKRKIGSNTPIDTVWKVIEENKSELFRNFDQVVAIFVSRYVNTPRANSLTVFDKVDFEKETNTK